MCGRLTLPNDISLPSAQAIKSHSQKLQSRNGGDIVRALIALARSLRISLCTVGGTSRQRVIAGPKLGDKIEVDHDRGIVRVWTLDHNSHPNALSPTPSPEPTKSTNTPVSRKSPYKRLFEDSPEVVAAIVSCRNHKGLSYPE